MTFNFSTILDRKGTLDIYNLAGHRVVRLFDANMVAGEEQTVLLSLNMHSGGYIDHLVSPEETKTGKLILLQ